MPFSRSKNFERTSGQPPRSAIVNRLGGCGIVELGRHVRVDGAIALLAEDALGVRRLDELEPGGCRRRRVDGHRGGVLDQDRLVGNDVLDRLPGVLGEDRLVLVGEQDVALPGRERLQCLTCALVLHRRVRQQLAQVLDRLVLGLAELELSAVRGHEVPLGAAGRERIRRHDLDLAGDEVVPGLNVLRVALANDEDDNRVRDHAVVLRGRGPVGRDEPGIDEAGHVRLQGEGDVVGWQAGLDGAALLARGGVRLLELDAAPGVGVLERGISSS